MHHIQLAAPLWGPTWVERRAVNQAESFAASLEEAEPESPKM
jgi:hypothetical protein